MPTFAVITALRDTTLIDSAEAKIPLSMLAGDQGLGPLGTDMGGLAVAEAFLFATTLCKLPPPNHVPDILQFPSYFPIICLERFLINRLIFPLGSMYH